MHVLMLEDKTESGKAVLRCLREMGPAARVTVLARVEDAASHLEGTGEAVVVVVPTTLVPEPEKWGEGMPHPPGLLGVASAGAPPRALRRWVAAGRRFVPEGCDGETLRSALRAVSAGLSFADPAALPSLVAQDGHTFDVAAGIRRLDPEGVLRPRLLRVAVLAALGCSNQEVANVLFLSKGTVGQYLHEACAALGIRGGRPGLRRRLLGLPPCRGVAKACPFPTRSREVPLPGRLPSCPGFLFCLMSDW